MNLRAAFLARSAKVNADGSFDVEGGGVTDFWSREPGGAFIIGQPVRLEFALVLRFELDQKEIGQLLPLRMVVVFNGRELASNVMPLVGRIIPGETRYYHNAIVNLVVDVDRPGDGEIRISWDGGLARIPSVRFRVGQRPT